MNSNCFHSTKLLLLIQIRQMKNSVLRIWKIWQVNMSVFLSILREHIDLEERFFFTTEENTKIFCYIFPSRAPFPQCIMCMLDSLEKNPTHLLTKNNTYENSHSFGRVSGINVPEQLWPSTLLHSDHLEWRPRRRSVFPPNYHEALKKNASPLVLLTHGISS